jgi:hypothetical protein
MVNGRLVKQKKRTKTEEAKGNYVQIQMIAAISAVGLHLADFCSICSIVIKVSKQKREMSLIVTYCHELYMIL